LAFAEKAIRQALIARGAPAALLDLKVDDEEKADEAGPVHQP
jgi:hypothetical protein